MIARLLRRATGRTQPPNVPVALDGCNLCLALPAEQHRAWCLRADGGAR